MAGFRPRRQLIDVHAHFFPEIYREALKEAGYDEEIEGEIPTWHHNPKISNFPGVSAYISLPPPGTCLYPPSDASSAARAADLCEQLNRTAHWQRWFSEVGHVRDTVLGFFASLPLPHVDASLAEVARWPTNSSAQPGGYTVLTRTHGVSFLDPSLDPVYAAIAASNSVVLVHPSTSCASAVCASSTHANGTLRPVPERLPAQKLDYLHEAHAALRELHYSSIPHRYPQIRWIFPFLFIRYDAFMKEILSEAEAATLDKVPTSEEDRLKLQAYMNVKANVQGWLMARVFAETSGMPLALSEWAMVDHRRLLWGSGMPCTAPGAAQKIAEDGMDALAEAFGIETGANEVYMVSAGNAVQLLGSADLSRMPFVAELPGNMPG